MKAWIDNQRGVGYVVCWLEDRHSVPLRNFGQMQSAAFEFRNWLNRCVDERLPRWVSADTQPKATGYYVAEDTRGALAVCLWDTHGWHYAWAPVVRWLDMRLEKEK